MTQKALLATILGLALSATAYAGMKSNYAVIVSGSYASAQLGNTRATANTLEYLNCEVSSSGWGSCSARNSAGTNGYCSFSDPALVAAAQSIQGDSLVSFWWDANGTCTAISIRNGSNLAPKQP